MKRPKTTQEKRWNEADEEYVRPKRKSKNLADAWDDITKSEHGIKSWKKYRKKQWK